MIQDIGEHIFNNQYDPDRKPCPDDFVVFCSKRRMLLRRAGSSLPPFPTVSEYLAAAQKASGFVNEGGSAEHNSVKGCLAGSSAADRHAGDRLVSCSAEKRPAPRPAAPLIYLFSLDGSSFFLARESHGSSFFLARESHGTSGIQYPSPASLSSCAADRSGAPGPSSAQDLPEIPECAFYEPRELRKLGHFPQEYIFAAFTALHLADWYRRKRFCGACGAALIPDARERAMTCPVCGETYYPRINPAVIVGVTNGDRLLVTRYARGFAHNALVAGFAEIGETFEQTVAREVMEETGIRVKNIRYYRSQPWGIASDLLAGFFCDVDGDDRLRPDGSELRSALWVPRAEIEYLEPVYSLTSEMMMVFKEGRI